ncbi:MAG: O-antigen ligase family protein [Anaerovoracaceae bacterium]
MNTERRKAEHVITEVFFAAMCSVFLFYGADYTCIAKSKYTIFLALCGGYCGVMLFMALQRLLLAEGGHRSRCLREGFRGSGERRLGPAAFAGNAGPGRFCPAAGARAAGVLYLVFTLISAFSSAYFPGTLAGLSRHEGALTLGIYVLLFLLAGSFAAVRPYHAVIFAVAVIVYDLTGLLQIAGGNPFGFYPEGLSWADRNVKYSGEFLSFTGNADLSAGFLCIAAPLFLCLSLWEHCRGGSGWRKGLFLAAGLLSAGLAAASGVQAGLLGLAAAAALWGPAILGVCFAVKARCGLRGPGGAGRKIRRMVLISYIVLLFLVLFVGAFLYADGCLRGTPGEIHAMMHGEAEDGFGSGRVYIYRNILARIPENLWFGTGPDTVGTMEIAPFQRYDPETNTVITAVIDTAHSEPLNILACQGIFALISWLAVIFFSAWAGIRSLLDGVKKIAAREGCETGVDDAKLPEELCRAVCLLPALTAYGVQSLFSFSSCAVSPYFWILCGLLTAGAPAPFCPSTGRPFPHPGNLCEDCRKSPSEGQIQTPQRTDCSQGAKSPPGQRPGGFCL